MKVSGFTNFLWLIVGLLVLSSLISAQIKNVTMARDDTDPPGARSGLGTMTDCRTGVQYLTTARGGVTPRVNRDGSLIVEPCNGVQQ